jgi:SAM-dependent methyltransferase
METDRFHFLDIGGGPNEDSLWDRESPDIESIMSNLRVVQLARQNPNGEYTVLDAYFPLRLIAKFSNQFPNVHFIQVELSPYSLIPLEGRSMDRVEMNFVFTPFTDQLPMVGSQHYSFGFNPQLYVHALEEACRVLKPGGTLAITEKRERLDKIKRLLSKDSWLDLDGYLMTTLGLDDTFGSWTESEVTNPTKTLFTEIAIEQQQTARDEGDEKKVGKLRVFCLELRKK